MIDAPGLKTLGRTAVMVPHMDDEVIGCGGLLARESDLSSTHLVFFNDGVSKYAGGRQEDFRIRSEESRVAATVLGVPESNLLFLGIPSRVLRTAPRERVDWLRNWIKENRIERVLIPFRYDRHPDHLATHRLTVKALTGIAHDIEVWEYFVYFRWRLLRKGDVRRYLESARLLDFDIGDVTDAKRKALECFESQTTVVAGRDRPVLSAEYVRSLLAEPEIFLVSSSARTMDGVFTIPESIIRIVHYVEPRLKLWKDGIRRFVATRLSQDHAARG